MPGRAFADCYPDSERSSRNERCGEYKEICPRCGEREEGETIGHTLLECRRWGNCRRVHLSGVVSKIGAVERSKHGHLRLLLGGKYMDQK